ncbi:MAG: YbfB/YjiJ family MFS transporter [Pseudomonadota bacterium]|nr:YbfB/YjiJ family MFS transporter [Pseudomonadota bacterium]
MSLARQKQEAANPLGSTDRHDFLTVAALALAPAVGLGIARFAYALVLPDMRADLGWTYADAGRMTAANALGYLIGALFAARTISAGGAFRVMVSGAFACVVALGLCAIFRNDALLNAAWFLAGIGGSLAFVAGGVLATGIAQRHPARASFLLGLFYAGPGLGILLSGVGVPLVLEQLGPGSWPAAWTVLAVLSLPLTFGLWFAKGEMRPSPAAGQDRAPVRRMAFLLVGYFIFGAGYIAYMTFMIAWVQNQGAGAGFQSLFWIAIGLAAMVSPWLWAGVLKRRLHGRAFATLTGVTALGAALPLLSGAKPVLLASATLFGGAFFAVVAATTAFVRRNLPPQSWASGIGVLTVSFGLGQALGPIGTGLLNDFTGGLSGGLWASAGLLLAAASIGSLQRDLAASPPLAASPDSS